ncbi:hypothetical protein G8764_19940 [Pseudomaricurvus alcaniphilus]|uniref:lipopolysaccharide biosynthesis protein n=1 Tax=Pseudomaricurvus alcaniphilus TaxID=1166482 RepID=UPI001407F6FD|nr:hypothetical protein [Pseudomaricurvus alcaniphilus]NHN39578.1 hypothetical protein [Pseudomaricurvus alcaniphilus]
MSVFFLKALGAIGALCFALFAKKVLPIDVVADVFLAYSIVNILSVAYRFGSEAALLKVIPLLNERKDYQSIRYYAVLSCRKVFYIFIVCVTICVISGVFFSISYTYYYSITLALLWSLLYVLGNIFQSINRPVLAIFCMNISLPFVFCLSLTAYYFNFISIAREIFLLTGLCLLIFLLAAIRVYIQVIPTVIGDRSEIQCSEDYTYISRNTFLGSVSQQVIQWFTPLIAGVYLEPEASSAYFFSQRVAFSVGFLLVVANFKILPYVSLAVAKGNIYLAVLELKKANFIVALLGLICLIVIGFSAGVILDFAGYRADGLEKVLIVLLGAQLFNVLTGSISNLLNMVGLSKYGMFAIVISSLVNVGSCVLLINFWGEIGLAVSVVISVAVLNVTQVIILYWKEKILFSPFLIGGKGLAR